MNTQTHINVMPHSRDTAQWFRRLTLAGFMFFLVKGMFWLALALWAVG